MPWYILSLSYAGEKESFTEVVKAAKKYAGKKAEVFSPSIQGEGTEFKRSIHLVEGYVFVSPTKALKSLMKAESDPIFSKLVTVETDTGLLVPYEIEAWRVEEMRNQLAEMRNPDKVVAGDTVQIVDGTYRHLEGLVLKVVKGKATVKIVMHSKTHKPEIPLFCLEKESPSPK